MLSASGDKTSKVWDVNVNSVVNTFTMGSNVLDQQLGCLWQKDHLLSISLSGYINYLDKNNPSKPLRVIKVRPCCPAALPAGVARREACALPGGGEAEVRPGPLEQQDADGFGDVALAEVGGQVPSSP